ncbi:hypothetical protein EB001_06045 [bacterium]|jgi:hypothetical protein|nr:hypothetical protein [bacterium]
MPEKVIVVEEKRKVIVKTPGPQGPAGRTILNGSGAPSNNLGITGDFYVNNDTHQFYGPKLTDFSWTGANVIQLATAGSDYAYSTSWELAQVTGPVSNIYSVEITHNLGFYPNVTVKSSSGDMLETGINYNNTNTITLTMAQPFSGTAYLS